MVNYSFFSGKLDTAISEEKIAEPLVRKDGADPLLELQSLPEEKEAGPADKAFSQSLRK